MMAVGAAVVTTLLKLVCPLETTPSKKTAGVARALPEANAVDAANARRIALRRMVRPVEMPFVRPRMASDATCHTPWA